MISWSISMKVWDLARIELTTPVSAVRDTSVVRHITNCATQPSQSCPFTEAVEGVGDWSKIVDGSVLLSWMKSSVILYSAIRSQQVKLAKLLCAPKTVMHGPNRPSVKSVYQKLIFLCLNQNICCGYSKEPSQWDGSFEHPKHMFKLMD